MKRYLKVFNVVVLCVLQMYHNESPHSILSAYRRQPWLSTTAQSQPMCCLPQPLRQLPFRTSQRTVPTSNHYSTQRTVLAGHSIILKIFLRVTVSRLGDPQCGECGLIVEFLET